MVVRIHKLDLAAHSGPQIGQQRNRLAVGARFGRKDAPAVLEQFGETGFGPREFRTRHRMAGDEMHARRQKRIYLGEDRAFDRADIG